MDDAACRCAQCAVVGSLGADVASGGAFEGTGGFAQITAVFSDSTDIYFARQQVAERMRMAEDRLPAGVMPEMGPIATGLGDIFMWTVEYRELDQVKHRDGEPGLQRDGSYITPEGEHLVSEADKAMYEAKRSRNVDSH